MITKIEKLDSKVNIPTYGSVDSAGFDLQVMNVKAIYKGNEKVNFKESFIKNTMENGHFFLRPFERVAVGCGFKMELPEGYQMEVRSRSGVSLKRGLTIVNSPGTIDNDYRGEIGLLIINTTPFLAKIEIGERLAQGVIMPYFQTEFKEGKVNETDRGENGMGSTGNK